MPLRNLSVSYFNMAGGDIVHFTVPTAGVAQFEDFVCRDVLGLRTRADLEKYAGHYVGDREKSNICKQFIRHNSVVIHPSLLCFQKIPVQIAHQQPGQFYFTFGNVYTMSIRTSLSIDVST